MNFLVTGALSNPCECINEIKKLNHSVLFMKNECDELPCKPTEIEGVICNALFIYHSIDEFKNLKYIQLTSAGFDRIPIDYVKQHDICLHNARGVYSIPMAEFALSGVLQLYKQTAFFARNQEKHLWIKNRDLIELNNKTISIVGFGNVGIECAKRFKAFGTTIFAVDIIKPSDEYYDKYFCIEDIKQALSISDVVVVTMPLTNKTRGLFDKDMFSNIKKGAVLVNIARGALIKEKDLICALNQEILYGAVLDVFEEEPLRSDSLLWDMDNVIITPHNSFVGENNSKRLENVILTNLKNYKNK